MHLFRVGNNASKPRGASGSIGNKVVEENQILYEELGPPSLGSHHYPMVTPSASTTAFQERDHAPLRPPQPPFAGGKTSTRIKALMGLSTGGPTTSKQPRSRNTPPGDEAASSSITRHTAQQAGGGFGDSPLPSRRSSESIPSSPSSYYPGTRIPVPPSRHPPPPHIDSPQQLTLIGEEGAGDGDPRESYGPRSPSPYTESGAYTAHPPHQTRDCKTADHIQDTKSPRRPLRILRTSVKRRRRVSASPLEDVAEEDIQGVPLPGSANSCEVVSEPAGHGSFDKRQYLGGTGAQGGPENVDSCERVVSRRGKSLELGPPGPVLSSKSAGKCVSKNWGSFTVSNILMQVSRQLPRRRGDRYALLSYGRAANGSRPIGENNRIASMPNLKLYNHENLPLDQSLQQCRIIPGSDRDLPPGEGDIQEAYGRPSGEGAAETTLLGTEPLPDTICSDGPPIREAPPEKPPKPPSTKIRPWASWLHKRRKEGNADPPKSVAILHKNDERLREARAKEEEKSHTQKRWRKHFPLRE